MNDSFKIKADCFLMVLLRILIWTSQKSIKYQVQSIKTIYSMP